MTTPTIPRVGLLATVRNRHGVVAAVQPFDGEGGRLHLVHLEYKDLGQPADEQLLWELETGARLVEPTALPDPAQAAMPPADFDALLRAPRNRYAKSPRNGTSTKPASPRADSRTSSSSGPLW